MVFEGRFNSKVFIDFMSRLIRQNEARYSDRWTGTQ
jgi:hypothetical protein